MRIIFIRHAQSSNNILSEISYDAYSDSRSEDALVTEEGEKAAIILGKYLKHNSFKIDKCKKN
jgi:broad specificity phosphatase PhoE